MKLCVITGSPADPEALPDHKKRKSPEIILNLALNSQDKTAIIAGQAEMPGMYA